MKASISMLYKLIDGKTICEAPNKITLIGKWHSVLIPIGLDNTAEILMSDEDLIELNRIVDNDIELQE